MGAHNRAHTTAHQLVLSLQKSNTSLLFHRPLDAT